MDAAIGYDWRKSRLPASAAGLIVGLGAAITYGTLLIGLLGRPIGVQLAWVAYLTLLFGSLAYWAIRKLVVPRLSGFSLRGKILWAIGALATGLLIVMAAPIGLPPRGANGKLKILATGEMNPASQGIEVWVERMRDGSGEIPLSEVKLHGDWEIRRGVPLHYAPAPASLEWNGWCRGDLHVTLTSHAWSGIVVIQWNGTERRIDLYRAQGGQQRIVLPTTEAPIGDFSLLGLVLRGCCAVALAAIAIVLGLWLGSRRLEAPCGIRPARWMWLAYALPCVIVWLAYWLAFYPGVMLSDSYDQFHQAMTGQFHDAHPAAHTFVIWLVTRLWRSPAAVSLAQILALAGVAGWGLAVLRRMGVAPRLTWLICLAFALSPVNSLMVIELVKDMAFTIGILALSIMLMQIVASDGEWLNQPGRWLALASVSALTLLVRHNGPHVVIGALLILLAVYWRQWRRIALSMAMIVCIWIAVKGPLYHAARVDTASDREFEIYPVLHHLGAHVHAGTPLTSPQRELLERIHPLEDGWLYDPYSVRNLWYSPHTDMPLAWQRRQELRASLLELLRKNPWVDINHQLQVSCFVWRMTTPPDGYFGTTGLWMEHGQLRYIWDPKGKLPQHESATQRPVSPRLHRWLSKLAVATDFPPYRDWIWRTPLYLYLAIGAVIIWSVRMGQARALLILAPILLNSAVLMLAAMEQTLRHQYPVYAAALLLIGLPFARFRPVALSARSVLRGR